MRTRRRVRVGGIVDGHLLGGFDAFEFLFVLCVDGVLFLLHELGGG